MTTDRISVRTQQHDADRRGVSPAAAVERLVVEVERGHFGPPAGADSAAGHHLHEHEDIERDDADVDQRGAERLPDQREGDVPERGPAVGAVEHRRLVERRRDRLHAGDVDDHVEADAGPDDDRHDRPENGGRVAEPGPLQTVEPNRAQRPVEQADVGVIDVAPEHADDDGGDDLREEEDDPVEAGAADRVACPG